jgi:predicted acylesterase/phospholipase RssA
MNNSPGKANTTSENGQSASQPQWIGLALSGGGFRATLFHLGLVRALRDCGLLGKVKLICSVSGGSILATHMVLNWGRYIAADEKTFDEAAKEIIKFTKSDLRNSLMRRWIGAWLFPVPFVLNLRLFRLCGMNKLLQKRYDRFFNQATFKDLQALNDRPEIRILATSLTTGTPCIFSNFKFEVIDAGGTRRAVKIDTPKVSVAVAASSGYPVLFPGIRIDNDVLGCDLSQFPETHYLTDGGVYDNLGIEELIHASANRGETDDWLIVADASSNFDLTAKRFKSAISIPRSLRANDIMMHQLGQLRTSRHQSQRPNLHRIGIEEELVPDDKNQAPPLSVQRAVRNIGTDFKPASDLEIDALLRHGQSKTREALRRLTVCQHGRPLWSPAGDHRKKFEKQNLDKHFKWLSRGRSLWLASYDRVTLAILLWVAFLVWFPKSYFDHKLAARSQAETTENFTVRVLDRRGKPIPNAKVSVQFDDTYQSTYESKTDADGYMKFSWKATAGRLFVHIAVEAAGFSKIIDDSYLTARETHPIKLFD